MTMLEIAIATAVSALLVALCVFLHWLALRGLYRHLLPELNVKRPLLKMLFALFGLHLFEVLLYAVGQMGVEWGGGGELHGEVGGGADWFFDHLYFSLASYTTLGLGDIMPRGALRLIAGTEALTGLVLITWSASFTYLMMERLWGREMADD